MAIQRTVKEVKKGKKDRWIGSAQTLIDIHGHTRAVLVHEAHKEWLLIGPIDCVGEGVDELKQRRGNVEGKMKRMVEKELFEAGYEIPTEIKVTRSSSSRPSSSMRPRQVPGTARKAATK